MASTCEVGDVSASSADRPHRLTNGELSYRFAIVRPSRDGKQIFAVGTKWRGELVRYDVQSQSFVPFLSGIAATDAHSRATGNGSAICPIRTTPFGAAVQTEPIGCS